jgi:perosamine synthetase
MHEQPVFQRLGLFRGETYPIAENIARQGFYLPSGMALEEHQIRASAEALGHVINNLQEQKS